MESKMTEQETFEKLAYDKYTVCMIYYDNRWIIETTKNSITIFSNGYIKASDAFCDGIGVMDLYEESWEELIHFIYQHTDYKDYNTNLNTVISATVLAKNRQIYKAQTLSPIQHGRKQVSREFHQNHDVC
jgi:hypothetical protein